MPQPDPQHLLSKRDDGPKQSSSLPWTSPVPRTTNRSGAGLRSCDIQPDLHCHNLCTIHTRQINKRNLAAFGECVEHSSRQTCQDMQHKSHSMENTNTVSVPGTCLVADGTLDRAAAFPDLATRVKVLGCQWFTFQRINKLLMFGLAGLKPVAKTPTAISHSSMITENGETPRGKMEAL